MTLYEFALTGPRGDNPLGFLAALGALVTLEENGRGARLGWDAFTPRLCVSSDALPEAHNSGEPQSREVLIQVLSALLRRERGSAAAVADEAKKEMKRAKAAVKKKREDIKGRKLGRAAAKEARQVELLPLEENAREKERLFKLALMKSAADPCVALGTNLTATNGELTSYFEAAGAECSSSNRGWIDISASYGVSDPNRPDERMLSSPWALIRGDSQQNFLESVENIMTLCGPEHLKQALFGPWIPRDMKYSLRWDTADDRRYALMEQDPTAGGNEPKTLWGANRLAFEALRFFPAMPVRGGMGVVGWRAATPDSWQEDCAVRWPLWDKPVSVVVVRSLLGLRDIWRDDAATRNRLRALGVSAVMESRRIGFGQATSRKYNLTPAGAVWASAKHVAR